MGSWPFTRLHYGRDRYIVIAGPHIQLLDAISGSILHKQRSSSNLACSAVDQTQKWLVTTGEDKRLNVWALENLELQSSRELPKKATVVQLSRDAQTILVADKFGDVFSYPRVPLLDTSQAAPEPKKRDAVASHATPHGSLILGHASIITALLLSHDGRHIITADRDEHIRVSRYPRGYIIERYCLGHRLFLSALCIPAFEHTTLISGGGDPCLHLWDWMSGTLRCQIPIVEAVRPFLRVRETKPRWHHFSEGSRKGRRRGKKVKIENDDQSSPSNFSGDAMEVKILEESESFPLDNAIVTDTEFVFAPARIETIDVVGERKILFMAFGASALFYCRYPSVLNDVPEVRHIEFSRPVLDFVVNSNSQVLVSLDTGWIPPSGMDVHNPSVTLLSWQDGALKLCEEASPLVEMLNGAACLDASDVELATLDLYAALSLLPKHAEGGDEGDGEQDLDSRPGTPSQHAKVAGRLKTKQALLRRQEQERGSGDEPEPKKIKLGDDV